MGEHGEEEVVVGLGKNAVPEVAALDVSDVSGNDGSNPAKDTTEETVKRGLSGIAIGCIVVACVVVLVLAAIAAYFVRKKCRKTDNLSDLSENIDDKGSFKNDETVDNIEMLKDNPISLVESGNFKNIEMIKMFIDSPFTGHRVVLLDTDAKIFLKGFTVKNIGPGSNNTNATYKSIEKLVTAMCDDTQDPNYKNDAKLLFKKEISQQYAQSNSKKI